MGPLFLSLSLSPSLSRSLSFSPFFPLDISGCVVSAGWGCSMFHSALPLKHCHPDLFPLGSGGRCATLLLDLAANELFRDG